MGSSGMHGGGTSSASSVNGGPNELNSNVNGSEINENSSNEDVWNSGSTKIRSQMNNTSSIYPNGFNSGGGGSGSCELTPLKFSKKRKRSSKQFR